MLCSLWVFAVLGCGCRDWHEAERIVATADSLDALHEVYTDTVALRTVVEKWDKKILRQLKHNPLGRAYYYLGRNYDDFYADYATATQCYIRSDRLGMDAPLACGRVNACMGYICSQHNADSLALWYNERALRYFQTAGDSFYYASALLTLSVSYASQGDYAKSDSLWQAADRYALSDAAFEAYRCDSRIYYYMHRSAYDSALVWLQKVAPTTSLRVVQRAIAWEHTGRMDSAVWYAEQVIAQSGERSHRVGAYYILHRQAVADGDMLRANDLAAARMGEMRQQTQEMEGKLTAVHALQAYREQCERTSFWQWLWVLVVFLCAGGVGGLYWGYKRFKHLKQHESDLTQQLNDLTQVQAENMQRKCDAMETTLNQWKPLFAVGDPIWQDEKRLTQQADTHLFNIYTRLHEQYGIDMQDFRICLLTLFEASRSEIAETIHRAVSSVPKLRSNTARKLGTSNTQLRAFLIEYLVA
ncbi:MAG: hypothetical protein ACI4BD_08005 [Paludibacteraceae bacterium]